MITDYFKLAFKNLRHRGLRSWLTLLGIFIGILSVVSLISLSTGLKMAVSSQFGISSTEIITVEAGGISGYGPPGSGAVNPLTIDDVEAIGRLPSVDVSIGRLISTHRMEFNNVLQVTASLSIPYDDLRNVAYDIVDLDLEKGRLLKDDDDEGVIVGWNFYADDDLFGKRVDIGNKINIDGKEFVVYGIYEKRGSVFFDNTVYMNEDPIRELTNNEEDFDMISVKVKNSDLMEKGKEEIEKLMRKRRDVKVGEEDFEVSTPDAMLENVNNIMNGIQAFIVIVASISILVGVLGITNTMTTSVLERKKEIGIMKAIGARNSQIFLQFFIESGMMGLVGGLLGVTFGTLIGFAGIAAINNFLGSEAAFSLNFILIGFALFGSFSVGALAGIAPAMNAARQDPVEALR